MTTALTPKFRGDKEANKTEIADGVIYKVVVDLFVMRHDVPWRNTRIDSSTPPSFPD